MSVFSDKRVFGIKRQNCGGVSTAGQVCANDVILWVIFLLPINIVIHGAGQCLVAMRSEERRVGKECRSRWSPYH